MFRPLLIYSLIASFDSTQFINQQAANEKFQLLIRINNNFLI
jgi:hypothetical protein